MISFTLQTNRLYILEFHSRGGNMDASTLQRMQQENQKYVSRIAGTGQLLFAGVADDGKVPMMILQTKTETEAEQIAQQSPLRVTYGFEAKVRDFEISQFGGMAAGPGGMRGDSRSSMGGGSGVPR